MKRLFRLKRKTGAVLFAVVCVMALLIAMASTAYYTARSAYKSVVSNYNFSQLYLSAISISDMMIDIVNNEPISQAVTDSSNDFSPLKDAIKSMDTQGAVIHAYSQNIAASDVTDNAAILNSLQSTDSAISSVVDGIVVEIELKKVTEDASQRRTYVDGSTLQSLVATEGILEGPGGSLSLTFNSSAHYDIYTYDYTFVLTTNTYYRNSTISVEDIVTTRRVKYFESTSTPTPVPPNFSSFLTATGQGLEADKLPNPAYPDNRVVKLSSQQITDDAFFQNARTYFRMTNGSNKFYGGIRSTGSLYLDKMESDIGEKVEGDYSTYNDWIIGEDLVLNHNTGTLNLKNNDLFVGRDLVITANTDVTAGDIYIEGDLYLIGQAKLHANVHVKGNIYYDMGDTRSDGSTSAIKWAEIDGENGNLSGTPENIFNPRKVPSNETGEDYTLSASSSSSVVLSEALLKQYKYQLDSEGNYVLDANGNKVVKSSWSANNVPNLSINGTSVYFRDDSTQLIGGNLTNDQGAPISVDVSTYNPESTKVDIANRAPSEDNSKYAYGHDELYIEKKDEKGNQIGVFPTDGTTESKEQALGSSHQKYDIYTSSQETYNNTVDIKFSELKQPSTTIDGVEVIDTSAPYEATFTAANGKEITVKTESNNIDGEDCKITVTIPYTEDGYSFSIADFGVSSEEDGFTMSGNENIKYVFEGVPDGETMPVVLRDNATVKRGEENIPSFKWQNDPSSNGNSAQILTSGTGGNISFEMANYTTDANGNKTYKPYVVGEYDKFNTVVYEAGAKEFVGSTEQFEKVGIEADLTDGIVNTLVDPVTKLPLSDDLGNKFALISNANGKLAVDSGRKNNAFLGYVYAPNGTYDNDTNGGSGTKPVLGGMIVSEYSSQLSDIYYADPTPKLMAELFKGFANLTRFNTTESPDDSDDTDDTDPTPSTPHAIGYNNFNYVGSNYVG